jgi:hypothetical protein
VEYQAFASAATELISVVVVFVPGFVLAIAITQVEFPAV